MKSKFPNELYEIDRIFRKNGHELYVVGGAVRNLVLGQQPVDWDLASSAKPEQVQAIFRHVIPTGIQHGTVTVRYKNTNYEVTTYRIDGDYSDSRRPDSVEYTANIFEDLKRRDFTINAMAYNLHSNALLDPHGGKEDIQGRIIRTVGEPLRRFAEDGLRILRGIRFASTLGFAIQRETFEAMTNRLSYMRTVSIERIRDEFQKILVSNQPSFGLQLARACGALELFLPELCATVGVQRDSMPTGTDLFDHLLATCDQVTAKPPELRMAALLHDIAIPRSEVRRENGSVFYPGHDKLGAEMAEKICKRLKYPNTYQSKCTHLIAHHMESMDTQLSDAALRRFIGRVGKEHALNLISLRRADIRGKHGPFLRLPKDYDRAIEAIYKLPGNHRSQQIFEQLDVFQRRIERFLQPDTATQIRDLKVNGNDLFEFAGIPKSPEMKTVLQALLEAVLEDPNMNNKEALINLARNFYKERIVPLKGEASE